MKEPKGMKPVESADAETPTGAAASGQREQVTGQEAGRQGESQEIPRENPSDLGWMALFPFGIVIGTLAALSQAVGTTTTLLGLLFTMIGGSLLSWRTPPNVSQEQLQGIVRAFAGFCIGVLVGLAVGFGLRVYDRAWLAPWIERKRPGYEEGQAEVRTAGQWNEIMLSLATTGKYDELQKLATAIGKTQISRSTRETPPPVPKDTFFTQKFVGADSLRSDLDAEIARNEIGKDVREQLVGVRQLVRVLEAVGDSEESKLKAAIRHELQERLKELHLIDLNDKPLPPPVGLTPTVAQKLVRFYLTNFSETKPAPAGNASNEK